MNKILRLVAIFVASLAAFGFFVAGGLMVQAMMNDPMFPSCRAFSGVCSATLVYAGYGAAFFGFAAGIIAARICQECDMDWSNAALMIMGFLLGVLMIWTSLEGIGLVPRYAVREHFAFGPQQAAITMLIGLASLTASLGSAFCTIVSKD